MRITGTHDELTQFCQIIAEQYIKNSYYLASKYINQEKSEKMLHNRKNDYMKYITKTCMRLALFTDNFDYAMQIMKQRAITVCNNNNFTIDPKN